MRFFQYRATDSSGRAASGTIRAATADSARDALVQAGYRVTSVVDPASLTASTTATATDQALRGALASPPLAAFPAASPLTAPVASRPLDPPVAATAPRRSSLEGPAAITINPSISTANPAEPVKTKFGRDKDLYLLFTQLGQYYRAGVSPQTALRDLATKSPSRYLPSLEEAEKAVGEGRSLSEVFARYPYLYSPDIIGALRAGEVSGYVAEACAQIGDQKVASHRLKRRLALLEIIAGVLFFFFPITLSIVHGAVKSIAEQDKANGSLPIWGTFGRDVGLEIWHSLPWVLPMTAAVIGFLLFWHSMKVRDLRHRLVLGFPFLGGRARAEAMARFTWALGMVSRGGTSPHETFRLAAESVPNLLIRHQLMSAAATMNESERLSAALRRSGTLPREYASMVETGETTGDVPRALSDISRATDADFRGRDNTAAAMSGTFIYFGLAVVTVFMLAFLYQTLYGGIITTLTSGD